MENNERRGRTISEDIKIWIKNNLYTHNGKLNPSRLANNGQWIKNRYSYVYKKIIKETNYREIRV